jgi:hypothetical protein
VTLRCANVVLLLLYAPVSSRLTLYLSGQIRLIDINHCRTIPAGAGDIQLDTGGQSRRL